MWITVRRFCCNPVMNQAEAPSSRGLSSLLTLKLGLTLTELQHLRPETRSAVRRAGAGKVKPDSQSVSGFCFYSLVYVSEVAAVDLRGLIM